RELIERSRFAPVQARWKVYVIDECHMLSTAAFNALLKTLEEPPPRVVFVLATTDPQRVLPTILSRCQRFDFRRIPLEGLQQHLGWIAEQEAIAITPEALHLVAQRAQGGLRDAESLAGSALAAAPPIEAAAVWELLGAVPEQELLGLAEALAGSDPLALAESCRQLLERGREPSALLQGLASLLRDLVLAGVAPDRLELINLSPALRPQLPELARRIGKARLLQWQAQLKGSEQQLRHSVNPRLWLEVLLLGLLAEASQASAGAPASVAPVQPRRAAAPQATPATTAAVVHAAPQPAAAPAPPAEQPMGEPAGPPQGDTPQNLPELWQQILAGLELPSTRMLLSQQAQLIRLDDRRAVVRVAGTWMAMVQSRLPLLEKALAQALGSSRQLQLESGDAPLQPPVPAPAAAAPQPVAKEPAPNPQPTQPQAVATAPAAKPSEAAEAAAVPQPSSGLDAKAQRLAEFFNGEVVPFDGELESSDGSGQQAVA
ncbi:MAG: DNA polymerase III subunit gamma/tau, partial [Cyanobacteria bacterium K_DeepCast_150m_m2_101]|nr:DNA polymerase III subunit gamma/tau [Cyanobacteria bacterium K_DeepCast_150m_m2_101]